MSPSWGTVRSRCSRTQLFKPMTLIWSVSTVILQNSAGRSSRKYKRQPEPEENWEESPTTTHWESEGHILPCRVVPSEAKGRVYKDLSPGSAYSHLFWHQGDCCFRQDFWWHYQRWKRAGQACFPVQAGLSPVPQWEHTSLHAGLLLSWGRVGG